ncbi:bifunctional diaminohydroxyphosphoribosylaminopyrimidine deaminase/5-amino-6-(5-phosphoribosylamino)uracil reductase RibD [Henriciella aquimarina]|uniref:bifunctional diaminohydroxyphosphoribosylaminopyrimidine deaminase/5-amino-6-(5-phosphoribosylamino)uracil reductase RibD n=1 Tax=Henriciella aquimarina TaxID=545261 RepID=UPI001F429423|nr:riboflavin biosynthesis protein RibD [Henriciella aquimarina]
MNTEHETHMRRAIELARAQHGRTGENPSVGCVIVGPDGKRISEGATADGGRPHAEEMALSPLNGALAKGAVAYVTLEPCRERSNGGAACSQRLVEAGVTQVVISVMDQHPNGAGGKAAIEAAGIDVVAGLLEAEAAPLYEDFFASLS